MPNLQSLDTLRFHLTQRGLPPDYVERSVGELADHHADLVAELRAKGQSSDAASSDAAMRLGDTRKLASRIVRDYQRRTWRGRWPLVSYLLLPIPLLLIGWVVSVASLYLLGTLLEFAGGQPPQITTSVQLVMVESIFVWLLLILPAALTYWWGRAALQTTRNRWYVLVTGAVLALAMGCCYHDVRVSQSTEQVWVAMTAPIIHHRLADLVTPMQIAKLTVPLLTAGFVVAIETRRRRKMLKAEPQRNNLLAAA